MAGSLQPRVKTWVASEDVVYSDLNAEFDNLLTAMQPLLIDDYSTNVTQMQVTTDPGEVGTESVATTLAGEIARLRFMLAEITGESEWYESPVSSLAGLANAVGTGLTANRLVSGRVRTGSQFPIFLVPNGAARTVKLDGTPTNFIYYVDGIEYNIDADVTLTNLTAAPSSQNTCLVNDTVANDQDWTKHTGENGTEITIDTVGTEITALVGKLAAFSLNNGSSTEYFIAEVGTNKLIRAKRGYFFDSSDNPVPRVVYSNNDTITLLKLTWIFVKSDETLTATYNNPTWSKDEPSSPSIGDYWYDTDNNTWKRYDVSAFVDADATLVGVCAQDTTNTVCARSFEFFANYAEAGQVEVVYDSATTVKSNWYGAGINVWGTFVKNDQGLFSWSMSAHLDAGVTEAASTYYYFYVTEEGDRVISNVRPYDRREDLFGWYHPHQSWRCVGSAFNNSSQDLTAVESFWNREQSQLILPSQTAASNIEIVERVIPLDSSGGAFTKTLPPAAYWRGQTLTFIKTSSDYSAITLDGFASETINGATTTTLNTQYESVDLLSDGTNIWITKRNIPSVLTAWTPTGTWSSNTTYSGFRKRIGDCEYYEVKIACAGGVTAATLDITLPNSLNIDTAKLAGYASNRNTVGFGQTDDGGSGYAPIVVTVTAATTFRPRHVNAPGGTTTSVSDITNSSPITWASGDNMFFNALVPIVGWNG